MKISNEDMAKMLINGKIKQFADKISDGDITFSDCGLDAGKNFLQLHDVLLFDNRTELEEYCLNLCAESPHNNCAVFTIGHEHELAFAVKTLSKSTGLTEFDWFELDDTWHCWNFISFEDEFNLTAYGILCETKPGEWIVITK